MADYAPYVPIGRRLNLRRTTGTHGMGSRRKMLTFRMLQAEIVASTPGEAAACRRLDSSTFFAADCAAHSSRFRLLPSVKPSADRDGSLPPSVARSPRN